MAWAWQGYLEQAEKTTVYWVDWQEDGWVAYIDRKGGRCNDYF